MSNGNDTSRFFPRPEAHAMKWDALLPPVRLAVRDLLVRIDGAVTAANQRNTKGEAAENVSNCFLVYGIRGSGKTTVLLSALDACDPKTRFFQTSDAKKNEDTPQDPARNQAKELADKLGSVYWLDVLDVEPLPQKANFLTTLLTRIRNAVCGEHDHHETTSIYEEGADSARQQLSRLINDATLMWEDIHETDTRSRASRQVAAADIYARFRKRFLEAMTSLSEEFSRRAGRDASHPAVLILPVDNIDRSTEHLHSIIKLAQMVSCPQLLLVMAGDREDIESFLERAYWKELISLGEGAGGVGVGKTGLGGEDETLAMARRQAAAASHKLFPPSHRIKVGLVEPIDTLKFCTSSKDTSDQAVLRNDKTIYELLETVTIPTWNNLDIRLVELFDARRRMEYRSTKSSNIGAGLEVLDEKYLTHAARHGLRLPARGVLDLWQLAYWASSYDWGIIKKDTCDASAETITRTMLRNAIAESNLSSQMGRCLQGEIIQRPASERTLLNFYTPNPALTVKHLCSLDFELRHDLEDRKIDDCTEIRSWLSVCRVHEVALSLEQHEQNPTSEDGSSKRIANDQIVLPSLVAAWLSVLYDILIWAKDLAVIATPDIKTPPLVKVSHEIAHISERHHVRKEPRTLWWTAPRWDTFYVSEVFQKRWEFFLEYLEKKEDNIGKPRSLACSAEVLPRLLAAGWVACVLETYAAFAVGDERKAVEGGLTSKLAKQMLGMGRKPGVDITHGDIEEFEVEVINAAANTYAAILRQDPSSVHPRVFFADEGVTFVVRDWLEKELPLMLSNLYVPADKTDESRCKRLTDVIHETQLAKAWKANSPFLLAVIEQEFTNMCSIEEKPSGIKPGQKRPYLRNLALLGSFADMHELWRTPKWDEK